MEIKHILCPVDFSDFSRHALEHAAVLARWYDASITVLHVHPVPALLPALAGAPGPLAPPQLPRPWNELRQDLHGELVSFGRHMTASGIRVSFEVQLGSAVVSSILDAARTLPADLIAIGTHGRSGVDRLMLGSVTEKVLRKATCPVLTIPPPVSTPPREALVLFERILCAVDFSPSSMSAVEYALSIAQEADAELLLLHVIEAVPEAEHWKVPDWRILEYVRGAEQAALTQLRSAVPDEARVWCRPEELVATGKAYREILRVSRERDVHLIVMGAYGRNPLDRLLFGSTTNHIVRAASCPVLTLRATD